jgi:oxygen-independent coproporphyrinogen-3 oxidase
VSPAPGLYVHVPFCRAACPYCDFAIVAGRVAGRERFVDRVLQEAELGPSLSGPSDTVYLGGGTPSALTSGELRELLRGLEQRLPIASEARVFLEANPEDVTPERLAEWREAGVGTLSLGAQSLDAEALVRLGRRHTPEDVRRAVRQALDAGFPTVSVDLIYGRPGQTEAGWESELREAAALGAHHLSCYQLTIHERTAFGVWRRRGVLRPAGEETEARLFRATHLVLRECGYEAYEVSNLAVDPRHRSLHNRKYWDHAPYRGLGPSAHSFDGRRRRSWNLRAFRDWERRLAEGRSPLEGEETLDPVQLALEALMLGFRTTDGVDLGRVRSRTGVDVLARNRRQLERMESEGLVALRGDRVVPTLEGLARADGLAAQLELPLAQTA